MSHCSTLGQRAGHLCLARRKCDTMKKRGKKYRAIATKGEFIIKKLRGLLQRKCHIKIELCVRLSVLRLFHVGHVVQNRRNDCRLLGTNGFHVKAENERLTAAGSRCRQKLKYENFTSSSGRLRQNIAPTKRAARAARLFLLIQPIKLLICGVVVAVVISLTP